MTLTQLFFPRSRANSASLRATASARISPASSSTPFFWRSMARCWSRRNRSSVPLTKNLLDTGAAFFSLMAKKLYGGQTNCKTHLTYISYTM